MSHWRGSDSPVEWLRALRRAPPSCHVPARPHEHAADGRSAIPVPAGKLERCTVREAGLQLAAIFHPISILDAREGDLRAQQTVRQRRKRQVELMLDGRPPGPIEVVVH